MQGTRARKTGSPSIDRVDTSKGYYRANVVVACHRCNAIKNDASLEELERIVEKIRQFKEKI
jgi:hypothetical protein